MSNHQPPVTAASRARFRHMQSVTEKFVPELMEKLVAEKEAEKEAHLEAAIAIQERRQPIVEARRMRLLLELSLRKDP